MSKRVQVTGTGITTFHAYLDVVLQSLLKLIDAYEAKLGKKRA